MPVLAHDVYTDQPGSGPYVIFPTHGHQILSNFTHIIGVSVLAFCFARRTENDRFTSWLWWSNLTLARLWIILIFADSWIFVAFSGIVVNGVGLSYSTPVCSLGIFGCIFFYATSKGLTYLFLVERVWVVCSAGKSMTRTESLLYKACALVVFGYTAIFIDMFIGRYAQIRDDGVCMIGLHSFATIPLLTYDLFINILLTSMFLWFLCREQSIGERLRRLARRTAVAAAVALTISCVNILILALLEGKQLGWVCLSSCAADVTVNALALFWVTGGASREPHWHGAFENKDVDVVGELPPLVFPVSFVADPETGAAVKSVEIAPITQVQQQQQQQQPIREQKRGVGAHFADLGESMRQKEFCEGSSKDGLSGHGDESQHRRNRDPAEVDLYSDNEDDDKRSAVMDDMDIEWDITDSSSSNQTHFEFANENGSRSGKKKRLEGDGDDDSIDSDVNRQSSWRLTLDLELQRPPLLSPDHPEPDSPATHETAESRTRLTRTNPSSVTEQSGRPPRRRRDEPKKQWRRQWSARARALAGSSFSQHLQSCSLFRPASSPAIPHPQSNTNLSCDETSTTSNTDQSLLPSLPPLPTLPTPVVSRTRRQQRVSRSHSDSIMRMRVSDLTMGIIPGRPRLSQ